LSVNLAFVLLPLQLLFFVSSDLWAIELIPRQSYYPENFYAQVASGTRDKDLQSELFRVLSLAHVPGGPHDRLTSACAGEQSCYQHISLGYRPARTILFGELHLIHSGGGYAILDAYCEELKVSGDFHRQPPGPGQIPDPTVLNAEHTWPQSRFSRQFDKDLQKSDLHILFPVVSHANSTRGNVKFGDVVSQIKQPCMKSRRGYTAQGGNEPFFEVPEAHKGNVARALFYFATRYHLAIEPVEENALRDWHRSDPVDESERERNSKIAGYQKVRNPFIDYPDLVDLIADF